MTTEIALERTRHFKLQKTSRQLDEDGETIMTALARMAFLRGTVAPPAYLVAMAKELAPESLPGVLESLEAIGKMEPREGETLLPSLGKILNNRPVRCTQ